ncbi:hypothetical protein KBC80_03420 [Candidatus Woesebacteria bacterium]|jgi:hypothetical protein|nr:hypothetical protein [Candidatus Woesebacteria bacterium]
MTPEIITYFFIILKALALFGIGLYIVFAFVIVRQEQLMAHVLEESFEPVLRLVCVLHLFAAIGVFPLAFILL